MDQASSSQLARPDIAQDTVTRGEYCTGAEPVQKARGNKHALGVGETADEIPDQEPDIMILMIGFYRKFPTEGQ